MFNLKQRVKVTKVEDSLKGFVYNGSPQPELYEDGDIFLGYCTEGELLQIPDVGMSLQLLRDKKNGIEAFGLFRTSTIKSVYYGTDHWVIETSNSVYIMESLDEVSAQATS